MYLIIDPGIRGTGSSFGSPTRLLQAAAYVRNPLRSGNGPAECVAMGQAVVEWALKQPGTVEEVVMEWPRIYTAGKQSDGEGNWRDPNDLLALVGVGCALAMAFPKARKTRYFPYEWKQQSKKDVMNRRTLKRLSEEELTKIEDAGELSHNIYDSIGIFLHHVGRLERVRVFPGAT